MKIGTTFSYKEAEFLGLNWQETLEAILKLGLNPIRIGTYWDIVEKSPGKFNFSIQDKIISQISKAKTDIILTVGVKAPRWPEFYFPQWLEEAIQPSRHQAITEADIGDHLFPFLEKVIKRYQKDKHIRWFNIENEPLAHRCGPLKLRLDQKILAKEVALARRLTKKPIVLNSWVKINPLVRAFRGREQKKELNFCLDQSDILGLSVYPKYPHQIKVTKKHWQFLNLWLEKAKAIGKDAWITELQAEPWENPGYKKNFYDPLGNKSCTPNNVEEYFKICQKLGFKTILLWGAEFWYRCLKENNDRWWQTVKGLISNQSSPAHLRGVS